MSSCTDVFCVQVSLSRASMTDGMTILAWSAHAHKDKETLWWVICYMWGDVRVFCWTQFSRWPFSSLPAKLDHHTHVNCRPPLYCADDLHFYIFYESRSGGYWTARLWTGVKYKALAVVTGQFDHCATRRPSTFYTSFVGCQHFRMLLQSENTLWPYWTFLVLLHTADRFHSHILVPNYTLSLLHSTHACNNSQQMVKCATICLKTDVFKIQ